MRVKLVAAVLVATGLLAGGTALHKSAKYMETNRFCGQCHEMEGWLQSLRNAETLAGKHYRTFEEKGEFHKEKACAACHYKPGVGGYVETKLEAIGELYVHFFENVSPSEFSGRVSRTICLKCHEEGELKKSHVTEIWEKNCTSCHITGHDSVLAFHRMIREQLTEEQLERVGSKTCPDCHGVKSIKVHEGLERDCATCHGKGPTALHEGLERDCATCHGE